ncbi:LmbU family transcriptional regulator [Streptomyces decoyicus]
MTAMKSVVDMGERLMNAAGEGRAKRIALIPTQAQVQASSGQVPGAGARPVGPPAGQVLTTGVGLEIPAALSFDDWERAGRQLARLVDSSCWWLGDWLVYGKAHYVDRYQRGICAAGLQYQTLRNYAWVSRRFDLARRRAKLSFQHHAEVASLPQGEQDVWLERAEHEMWSTKQLRNAIRDERADIAPPKVKKAVAVRRLEVPDNRVQRWRQAAEQSGIDLENWVMATLDREAGEALAEFEGVPALRA